MSDASKRILLTGGSGFLGRPLAEAWLRRGYGVTLLSRRPEQTALMFGGQAHIVGSVRDLAGAPPFDAVVNLAGAPIFGGLWTEKRKHLLRASRIDLTRELVDFFAAAPVKPSVWLNGSAVGVYGGQGEAWLEEGSAVGTGFSSRLCLDWEKVALGAQDWGARVCLLRTGVVLDNGGGMLGRLLPVYRLGLGGRLGDGRQYLAWIHRQDWLAAADLLLHAATFSGPVNLTAPHPVSNAEFNRELALALRRPAFCHAPAPVLKAMLGEMAELLLDSQRVSPRRLLDFGFEFNYPRLGAALGRILGAPGA